MPTAYVTAITTSLIKINLSFLIDLRADLLTSELKTRKEPRWNKGYKGYQRLFVEVLTQTRIIGRACSLILFDNKQKGSDG